MRRGEFAFELPQTVRAEWVGPATPRAAVVAFHGYGEGPERLLAAFEAAGITQRHLVVAPRAPHEFYDRRGNVVGSWMTRLRRDEHVERLREHAHRLVAAIGEEFPELPLAAFGFSQGAANAYRVGLLPELPFAALFALAGDMPPEIRADLEALPRRPIHLLWGRDDDRVPLARMDEDVASLRAAGYDPRIHTAAGGHQYLDDLLADLSAALDALNPRD